MLTPELVQSAIVAPLQNLARAREAMMRTVEIPAPRPASDFCPTCGGTMRNHPAWLPSGQRCGNGDWHYAQ